jgi:hypothetical protein
MEGVVPDAVLVVLDLLPWSRAWYRDCLERFSADGDQAHDDSQCAIAWSHI